MLDVHTHILPGIDDGSRGIKQSIAMLRREAKQGADAVVMTPHFYARRQSPQDFFAKREKAARELAQAIDGRDDLPQVHVGAEVAFFNGMSRAEDIEQFCIVGTRSMLIEMPFERWTGNVLGEIGYLRQVRGIQPVIAHIERYMRLQPMGTVSEMCDEGIWIQANASYFLDWRTRLHAMHMLKKERIHFIGSDCHNTDSRPPNIGDAFDEISMRLGENAVRHLEDMEYRLLEDY